MVTYTVYYRDGSFTDVAYEDRLQGIDRWRDVRRLARNRSGNRNGATKIVAKFTGETVWETSIAREPHQASTSEAVVHVVDWNGIDRYYQAPIPLIKEFKDRATKSLELAWTWWIDQTNFTPAGLVGDNSLPIKYGEVDMTLPKLELDYNDHLTSLGEWKFNE